MFERDVLFLSFSLSLSLSLYVYGTTTTMYPSQWPAAIIATKSNTLTIRYNGEKVVRPENFHFFSSSFFIHSRSAALWCKPPTLETPNTASWERGALQQKENQSATQQRLNGGKVEEEEEEEDASQKLTSKRKENVPRLIAASLPPITLNGTSRPLTTFPSVGK